jgi:hypothetical protein
MQMRKIRVVENNKPLECQVNNAIVYTHILPKIKSDNVLSSYFSNSFTKKDEMDRESGGKCKSCQLNKTKDLLLTFIADFKRCPDDKKPAVVNVLGQREWMSHMGKWINVITNEVEDIKYGEKEVPHMPTQRKESPQSPPESKPEPARPKPEMIQEPPHVAAPTKLEKASESPEKETENKGDGKRKVIFRNFQAPGDIVMMTAAVRDLHVNFPGKFITDVRTNSMPIWESNKYITKLNEKDPDVEVHDVEYNLIHQSNQGPFHFSEGFTEHFEEILGVRIRRRIGRGHIEIGPGEDGWGKSERESWFGSHGYSSETQYWIINAGYKNDFTCKMWPAERYQQIVDHYRGKILFVQIGHSSHNHPELEGVVNLVGKTDDRQLIRLVWASSGVITPCSYPMTLAAAVPVRPGACNGRKTRPCVVIAGGREPSGWQAHTEHQFIHTCGMLPCCDSGGCWASRVKPIGDGDEKDIKNMCRHVVKLDGGDEIPYCMDMISAEEVIRRIDMYYSFYQAGRKKTHSYNKR